MLSYSSTHLDLLPELSPLIEATGDVKCLHITSLGDYLPCSFRFFIICGSIQEYHWWFFFLKAIYMWIAGDTEARRQCLWFLYIWREFYILNVSFFLSFFILQQCSCSILCTIAMQNRYVLTHLTWLVRSVNLRRGDKLTEDCKLNHLSRVNPNVCLNMYKPSDGENNMPLLSSFKELYCALWI